MAGKITRTLKTKNKNSARQPRNIPHLASRLFDTPLLVDERKLDAIVPIFERKINGEPLNQDLQSDDYREPGELQIDTSNGIAVIPVIGTLIRRSTWLDAWSGLMSYSEIAENLECALNDARVKGILLQVDSCGGEAPGCFELCDLIYNARSQKPIWAIGDVDAMSAAYAILSSATQCYSAPRGHVGSIGVISVHLERSQQNEMLGLTYTVFRAGDRKGDFNPFEKLAPEAAAKQLTSMERTRQVFAETVARNRPNFSVQAALDTEGQWYDPEDGLQLGLIDGIATFEQAFAQLAAMLGAPPSQIEPPEQPEAPIEPEEIPPEAEPAPEDGNGAVDRAAQTGLTGDLPSEEIEMTTGTAGNIGTVSSAGTVASAGTVVDFGNGQTREKEIANLCKMSGHANMAADFILSEMSVPEVRQKLTDMNAERNNAGGDISNAQPGQSGGAGGGGNPLSLSSFIQTRPSESAVASWEGPLKAAQATNPRFAGRNVAQHPLQGR